MTSRLDKSALELQPQDSIVVRAAKGSLRIGRRLNKPDDPAMVRTVVDGQLQTHVRGAQPTSDITSDDGEPQITQEASPSARRFAGETIEGTAPGVSARSSDEVRQRLLTPTQNEETPALGDVKIGLKRMGKIRAPFYRVVVADSRTKRDDRAIEEIGRYVPTEEPSVIEIDSERAQYWLSVGAQPTEQVAALLKVTGDWQKVKGDEGAEPRPDKKALYEAALAAGGDKDTPGADTPRKSARKYEPPKADEAAKTETPGEGDPGRGDQG